MIITCSILIAAIVSGCQPSKEIVTESPPNRAPVIENILVENTVYASTENKVECIANDQDGDKLDYSWSASGGVLHGRGSSLTWTTPDTAGDYLLTVTVTDTQGIASSSSRKVVVVAPIKVAGTTPLMITELKAFSSSKDPVEIDPGNGRVVGTENQTLVPGRIWATVDIESQATDQEGHKLEYRWTTTAGKITGQGGRVSWTAPGTGGTYSVTVTAICDRGDSTSSTVKFNIKCCGQ